METKKISGSTPVSNSRGKHTLSKLIGGLSLWLAVLLLVGSWAAPVAAVECNEVCVPCHGSIATVHGNVDHAAALGSGPAGSFHGVNTVTVDCGSCHNTLVTAVHGNDCATCHPSPYDTLGIWGKGCQQGGCHPFYHQETRAAHTPFTGTTTGIFCANCHDFSGGGGPETKCSTCHATFDANDLTPPVTASNLQDVYIGAAMIDFSITRNGKVELGRTFYQLDGGSQIAAGKKVLVTAVGDHELDFWSMNQAGISEPMTNHGFFTIEPDTIAPTTTSNAKTSYTRTGTITLTATDNGSAGVKAIYYRLGNGAVQSGSTVVIPTASTTVSYTLAFWAEDWSGNVEAEKQVSFTVTR